MIPLCFLAVLAALGGLASVGLALGPAACAPGALLAAPALGAVSLAAGLAAAVVALRREGQGRREA